MDTGNLSKEVLDRLQELQDNNRSNSTLRKWMEGLLSFVTILNLIAIINLTVQISNLETMVGGNTRLQELRFEGVEGDIGSTYTRNEVEFLILRSENDTRDWIRQTFVEK